MKPSVTDDVDQPKPRSGGEEPCNCILPTTLLHDRNLSANMRESSAFSDLANHQTPTEHSDVMSVAPKTEGKGGMKCSRTPNAAKASTAATTVACNHGDGVALHVGRTCDVIAQRLTTQEAMKEITGAAKQGHVARPNRLGILPASGLVLAPGGGGRKRPSNVEISLYEDWSHLTQEDVHNEIESLRCAQRQQDHSTTVTSRAKLPSTASLKRKMSFFPTKLHQMLLDPDLTDAISWLPHGRAWKIHDQKKLEELALNKYFPHCKIASFMRLVNGWNFQRVKSGPDDNAYYHEFFLRGLEHISLMMRRTTEKKPKDFSRMSLAPDFYELSENYPLLHEAGKHSDSPTETRRVGQDEENLTPTEHLQLGVTSQSQQKSFAQSKSSGRATHMESSCQEIAPSPAETGQHSGAMSQDLVNLFPTRHIQLGETAHSHQEATAQLKAGAIAAGTESTNQKIDRNPCHQSAVTPIIITSSDQEPQEGMPPNDHGSDHHTARVSQKCSVSSVQQSLIEEAPAIATSAEPTAELDLQQHEKSGETATSPQSLASQHASRDDPQHHVSTNSEQLFPPPVLGLLSEHMMQEPPLHQPIQGQGERTFDVGRTASWPPPMPGSAQLSSGVPPSSTFMMPTAIFGAYIPATNSGRQSDGIPPNMHQPSVLNLSSVPQYHAGVGNFTDWSGIGGTPLPAFTFPNQSYPFTPLLVSLPHNPAATMRPPVTGCFENQTTNESNNDESHAVQLDQL